MTQSPRPNARSLVLAWQFAGLLCFLASMPMDVLSGAGPGWFSDPNDFQGWKLAYFSVWYGPRIVGSLPAPFVGIAVMSVFTVVAPFYCLTVKRSPRTVDAALSTIGLLGLWLPARPTVHAALNGELFLGAVPWIGGPTLVVAGMLYRALARRSGAAPVGGSGGGESTFTERGVL